MQTDTLSRESIIRDAIRLYRQSGRPVDDRARRYVNECLFANGLERLRPGEIRDDKAKGVW